MAIADRAGLPVAVGIASALPLEVTLVEATLDQVVTLGDVEVLIGDAAYDSDGLDARLKQERGITLVAPHRRNRRRRTQDGRRLRRYVRRWKVERLFTPDARRSRTPAFSQSLRAWRLGARPHSVIIVRRSRCSSRRAHARWPWVA